MSGQRTKYCLLANHVLSPSAVRVTDPKMISFIRKRVKEFSEGSEVCKRCYRAVEKVYEIKYKRGIANQNLALISSVSSSSRDLSEESTINKQLARTENYTSSSSTTQNNLPNNDDDWQPSENLLNGTHMPDVQPILNSRRPRYVVKRIVAMNPGITDNLLNSITGG